MSSSNLKQVQEKEIEENQKQIEEVDLNSGSGSEPSSPSSRDDPLKNVRPSKTSRWAERFSKVKLYPDTPKTPQDKDSVETQLTSGEPNSHGRFHTYTSSISASLSSSSPSSLRSVLRPPLRDRASVDLEAYRSPMASSNPVPELQDYLTANKRWARRMKNVDPSFFQKLSKQQSPQILWIGCSDSRVPANMIIDLAPGEVFVHRNVGNIFLHTDFNALSVLQYAVDVLKVKHIIVCGHYGCGAVTCAVENQQVGLIDNWLRHIKDLYELHRERLEYVQQNPPSTMDLLTEFPDQQEREEAKKNLGKKALCDLLCEINVARSLQNVCHTTIVQNAWARDQQLSVHAWCYRLTDGLIRDLDISANSVNEIQRIYQMIETKARAEK